MDRHLLNYLPPVLREVLEFQIINGANEPEISLAWDAITRVLANQFLEDADEDGVAVWEQELRLFPKDTDTLEARKARIKAKVWQAVRDAGPKVILSGGCGWGIGSLPRFPLWEEVMEEVGQEIKDGQK